MNYLVLIRLLLPGSQQKIERTALSFGALYLLKQTNVKRRMSLSSVYMFLWRGLN